MSVKEIADVSQKSGCGDSMAGGLAVALERNYTPQEALKFAVAVVSANALSPNKGDFKSEYVRRFCQK